MSNNLTVIKDYFGDDKPVTNAELKALTKEERQELADAITEAAA